MKICKAPSLLLFIYSNYFSMASPPTPKERMLADLEHKLGVIDKDLPGDGQQLQTGPVMWVAEVRGAQQGGTHRIHKAILSSHKRSSAFTMGKQNYDDLFQVTLEIGLGH